MTPPTLKSLAALATKGPWLSVPHPADRTVLVYGPPMAEPLVAECSPRSKLGQVECDANAQLISRFSPEVALALYNFLSEVQETHAPNVNAQRDECLCSQCARWRESRRLMSLLDGQSHAEGVKS